MLSSREVIALLEEDGFYLHRQKGSHCIYKHPTKKPITVPHPKKNLGKGLINRILKDAGLK